MERNWLIAMAVVLLLAACTTTEKTVCDCVQTVPRDPVRPPALFNGPDHFSSLWERQGDRVFFDFDKSTLKPESRDQLRKWVTFLNKYWNDKLLIEGHADERGTREYNLALGERRANAVKEFIIAQGVDPSRLSTISYGKERPAVLGSNEAAWAQNRRAVGVIR